MRENEGQLSKEKIEVLLTFEVVESIKADLNRDGYSFMGDGAKCLYKVLKLRYL